MWNSVPIVTKAPILIFIKLLAGVASVLTRPSNFFFRDRAWARFSLRRKEKYYTRVGFRIKTDTEHSEEHDYMIPVSRPGSLPSLQTANSRHLKPAWSQASISSYIQVSTSSIVRTRRLKVLSFLSFHSNQEVRVMRVSKHRRLSFGICFLAPNHHLTKEVDWESGANVSQPSLRNRRNHTSLVNGQAVNKWSIVSDICAHSMRVSSSCNPCFFLLAAVQQRSWMTSQMKNLHFAGAHVLRRSLAPSTGCWPMKKERYAEAVVKTLSDVHFQQIASVEFSSSCISLVRSHMRK